MDNELTYRLFFIGLAANVFLPTLRLNKYTRIVLRAFSAFLFAIAIFWPPIYPYIPSQLASSISDLVMNAWAWFVLILFAPFWLGVFPFIMNKKQQIVNVQQGNLIIHSAQYGLGPGRYLDITKQVRERVQNGELHTKVHPDDLGCHDPFPGEIKHLRVIYAYSDKEKRTIQHRDLEILNLPLDVEN